MGLQQWQSIVSIIVGAVGIMVMLVGVGRAWASLTAASAKLTALHGRLDTVVKTQNRMQLSLVQIHTFLAVHPTLRFRLPEAASPATVGPQDMFKEDTE